MTDYTLGKKFREELYAWQKETGFHSSTTAIKDNDHYRAIVAMGKDVMPYIIAEMRTRPCIGMLGMVREIMGDFPKIEESDRGRVKRIADIVVRWYDDLHG